MMNLLLLLDMAAADRGDRVAVQVDDDTLTNAELLGAAWAAAGRFGDASTVVYIGGNGPALPVSLFGACAAGIPFAPLNYRLSDDQLHELVASLSDPVVVAEGEAAQRLEGRGYRVVEAGELLARSRKSEGSGDVPVDSDGAAVLLHTSGTTAAPKAAVLRHRHLTSYVIGTIEFGGAGDDEAALVSVPPYHVAGLANLLSNLYLGRRIVYLRQFDAGAWVATVRRENVTNAMVVPTMVARICDALEADGHGGRRGSRAGDGAGPLPSLRALSYGGARTPAPVLQRVMDLLPEVALTNAYGLTETSSTIAVLGPEDHRAARDGDPVAVARLASAGRVLPTVEVQVRAEDGAVMAAGGVGEIWVRGEQVSGEYAGQAAPRDDEGWFPTRDRGRVDVDGYLFIEGRSDDTIIRGGENVAPAEIEEVLLGHPDVEHCAVVGLPDEEWGQRIAALVVPRDGAQVDENALREFARRSLRGSRTPDVIRFADSLPYTETGKLLRRVVQSDLLASADPLGAASAAAALGATGAAGVGG